MYRFAACKTTRSRIEGKNGFHVEGLHYIALKKKSAFQTVQVGAHADTAVAINQRTWSKFAYTCDKLQLKGCITFGYGIQQQALEPL